MTMMATPITPPAISCSSNGASLSSQSVATSSCLRLRGLPFSCSVQDLVQFFSGFTVLDVLLTRSEGKPNGQAFVLLPKAETLKAQVELNNKYIGKRFIEVFSSTVADMETARRMCAEQQKAAAAGSATTNNNNNNNNNNNSSSSNNTQQAVQQQQAQAQQLQAQQQQQRAASKQQQSSLHIIRLRGLPFSATPTDIKSFLAPIELPDGISSIQMARHPDLRPTGEAYVHLGSETEVMQALNKHKQMMGKRYIEVFPSCLAELQQSMAPPKGMFHQQQQDQGFAAGSMGIGTDAMHVPTMGGPSHRMPSIPTSNPVAQAAWLQQQQQLLRQQHHLQLQAAAQHKILMQQQQQQQRQAPNLRLQAQLQAQAQALPNMFGQMQLSDVGSSSGQHAQQVYNNSLSSPMLSVGANMAQHSGNQLLASPGAAGMHSMDGSPFSGGYNGVGMPGGSGLTQTAAATATAACSPSPLDVQYYPFFCAGMAAAPMSALMLQEAHSLQHSSLQMMSPSCPTALLNNSLTNGSNVGQQQPSGAYHTQELFSSSAANVLDSAAMAAAAAAAAAGGVGAAGGPAAFCSDPLLQGLGSGSIAAVSQGVFSRAQQGGMGRADIVPPEWLT